MSNIQANLILSLSELLADSGSSHWMYSGTAIRMAQIMRLNKEYHQGQSLRDRELRRRTFWACVCFDRMLAFLLSKPCTLAAANIGIALPSTDISLLYEENTHGLTLDNIAAFSRRPSEIGLAPYFIKTVMLWSELANLRVFRSRLIDVLPPTNPNSRISRYHEALRSWVGILPPVLRWTRQNHRLHQGLGQARTFIAMHFLIHGAFCVANQMYLPQSDGASILHETVDAAGWSILRGEPAFISAAAVNALAMGEMASYLTDVDVDAHSDLQSVWVLNAMLAAANTLFWLEYADDIEPIDDPLVRSRAKSYINLLTSLFTAWSEHCTAAQSCLATFNGLATTYAEAYLRQDNNAGGNFGEQSETDSVNCTSSPDPEIESQYRPKPGDGLPPLTEESLLSSRAALGLNVVDVSTNAVMHKHRFWLRFTSACPPILDGIDDYILGELDSQGIFP